MPDQPFLTEYLLRGLRVAQSVIVLAILLGLNLPNLLASLDEYHTPALGLAWFGVLLAVAVADAMLVARREFWGRARVPVAAGVLAASCGATAALPPAELIGPAHWTLGVVGWFGVLLFSDRGVRAVLAFLAVFVGLTVTQLSLAGRTGGTDLLSLAIVMIATGSFQLAVALAGSALRAVAAAATEAAVRIAVTRTEEAVAMAVHADREARYEQLRGTALPLLRGIGDGSLPPSDPEVRRRAALEAARMRRLFAEDGDHDDPLAAELAALIDIVERRGVEVRYSGRGARPSPPSAVCRALLDEISGALLGAQRSARVTLGGIDDQVVLSVVSDAPVPAAGRRPPGGIRTTTIAHGERTWVEARWTPIPVRHS